MENNKQMTIKQLAKDAKQRLKSGFWQEYKSRYMDAEKIAKQQSVHKSEVLGYYQSKISQKITKSEDEEFYLKVKTLLDTEGEVSNAIGRLVDHGVFDSLDYDKKQKYIFELSEKYLKAVERYHREKQMEKQ
ncbi:MAG: hypothetical protein ACI4M6_00950 [Christensenellaceae bacterium]